MRLATPEELERWDELVLANPDGGQSLQTFEWGEFKGRHGWEPHYFISESVNQLSFMLLRKKAKGWGDVWYCPKGPGVSSAKEFADFALELNDSDITGVVAKLEPEIYEPANSVLLVKSPFDIHISRATVIIDLAPNLDDLLVGFKQKTRYNIRLAERHGVSVDGGGANPTDCEALYKLMMETQARTGFAARSAGYYFDYWQTQAAAGQGHIFLAKHEGKVLAGAFVQVLGTKAWYKDGGSSREHSNLQAPYALQWGIMQWLREHEVTFYDLVGVPREGDVTSPLAGLVQFKTGFNGDHREFIGTYDLPLHPMKYWGWRNVGERSVLKLSRRLRGELWY